MPETSSSTLVSSQGDDRKGVRRLVQTPNAPATTIPKLNLEIMSVVVIGGEVDSWSGSVSGTTAAQR
jgi:hypothetical protein